MTISISNGKRNLINCSSNHNVANSYFTPIRSSLRNNSGDKKQQNFLGILLLSHILISLILSYFCTCTAAEEYATFSEKTERKTKRTMAPGMGDGDSKSSLSMSITNNHNQSFKEENYLFVAEDGENVGESQEKDMDADAVVKDEDESDKYTDSGLRESNLRLAQEESKCLIKHGFQKKPTNYYEEKLFLPFVCENSEPVKAQNKNSYKECIGCMNNIKTLKEDLLILSRNNCMSNSQNIEEESQEDCPFGPYCPSSYFNGIEFIEKPAVFCEGVQRKSNHFVFLKWNIRWKRPEAAVPLTFVLESNSGFENCWKTIGISQSAFVNVSVEYGSERYRWRVTAIGPDGPLGSSTSEDIYTINGYQKPTPPKSIFLINYTTTEDSTNAIIGWEPSEERSCFYKIVWDTPNTEATLTIRIKKPRGSHSVVLKNPAIKFHTHLSTYDADWMSEVNYEHSSPLVWEFTTENCLKDLKRFDKCGPGPPRNISYIVVSQKHDNKSEVDFSVVINWLAPNYTSESNSIDSYKISICNPLIGNENETCKEIEKTFTVKGNTTSLLIKGLEHREIGYMGKIWAILANKSSHAVYFNFNTQINVTKESSFIGSNILYFPGIFVSIITFGITYKSIKFYMKKRRIKRARNQYFKSFEEHDEMTNWPIIPLNEKDDYSGLKIFNEEFPKDKYEIAYEELCIGEIIGQGAFGIVRKAKIPKRHCLKMVTFDNEEEEDGEYRTVAIKMLKVSATRDAREQLRKEIHTMHSIGYHNQIVSLLGACSKGKALCLVLEYCPGGNLLNFLRKVREKYWPTLNLVGYDDGSKIKEKTRRMIRNCTDQGDQSKASLNETGSTSGTKINYADIGFSESSIDMSDERSFLNSVESKRISETTFNEIPESEKVDEDDDENCRPINEEDILSYARQICSGMAYLEQNRIVHRDIASRNVLLLGDYKHVKISDFGLSRDIYTWNVYQQKTDAKMPIKWMAIESIFTHIFTSKSDVWSFGILLWELVTLGGVPYPGLSNIELFDLLKKGYRMERPENCSEEFVFYLQSTTDFKGYALMEKCWRSSPSSRPNFTELRKFIEAMMDHGNPGLYLSLMAEIPQDFFDLSSRSDLIIIPKVPERSHKKKTSGGRSCSSSGSTNTTVNASTSTNGGNGVKTKSPKYKNVKYSYASTSTSSSDSPEDENSIIKLKSRNRHRNAIEFKDPDLESKSSNVVNPTTIPNANNIKGKYKDKCKTGRESEQNDGGNKRVSAELFSRPETNLERNSNPMNQKDEDYFASGCGKDNISKRKGNVSQSENRIERESESKSREILQEEKTIVKKPDFIENLNVNVNVEINSALDSKESSENSPSFSNSNSNSNTNSNNQSESTSPEVNEFSQMSQMFGKKITIINNLGYDLDC